MRCARGFVALPMRHDVAPVASCPLAREFSRKKGEKVNGGIPRIGKGIPLQVQSTRAFSGGARIWRERADAIGNSPVIPYFFGFQRSANCSSGIASSRARSVTTSALISLASLSTWAMDLALRHWFISAVASLDRQDLATKSSG